ncbi:MAG: hypothetical protein J5482_01635 [Oscillospiraceae bacterium]|nr:hypothetical protein [Oscillospiraceae bacterium]
MIIYKRMLAVILAAVLALGLIACGATDSQKEPSMEELAALLVQGNLDEIYLGKVSQEYLDLIGSTEEDARETYEEGLSYEAEYFADYFDIDVLSDPLKEQIMDLYREIYSHVRYTVGNASKLDENTYVVKVDVEPINVMELAMDAEDTATADFFAKYADVDVESMTDEEYEAYDAEWAQAVIATVQAQVPVLAYKPGVSLAVQVVRGDDGAWQISDSDMGDLDEQMIYYP